MSKMYAHFLLCVCCLLVQPSFAFFWDFYSHGTFTGSYFPPGIQDELKDDWSQPVLEIDFQQFWTCYSLRKMTLSLKSNILWTKEPSQPVEWQQFMLESGVYVELISSIEVGVVAKYQRDHPSWLDFQDDVIKNTVKGLSLHWDW